MMQLSPTAVQEVKRLRRRQRAAEKSILRISVQASGCAGLSYQMTFVETPQPEDQRLQVEDIAIAIDAQSLSCLGGLKLDYTEDLTGGSFRFHNPNAVQTCGCGHSFAVATSK